MVCVGEHGLPGDRGIQLFGICCCTRGGCVHLPSRDRRPWLCWLGEIMGRAGWDRSFGMDRIRLVRDGEGWEEPVAAAEVVPGWFVAGGGEHEAAHCSTRQHIAAYASTLQHTPTYGSAWQHNQ